ncbi:MAG: hypothetical protein WCD55_02200 [Bacteroidales bacterium]
MFLKLLILSVILVGLALAGLAISILIKPKGRFPETHISRNKEMGKRGIRCAQDTDLGCKPGEGPEGCAGCPINNV